MARAAAWLRTALTRTKTLFLFLGLLQVWGVALEQQSGVRDEQGTLWGGRLGLDHPWSPRGQRAGAVPTLLRAQRPVPGLGSRAASQDQPVLPAVFPARCPGSKPSRGGVREGGNVLEAVPAGLAANPPQPCAFPALHKPKFRGEARCGARGEGLRRAPHNSQGRIPPPGPPPPRTSRPSSGG